MGAGRQGPYVVGKIKQGELGGVPSMQVPIDDAVACMGSAFCMSLESWEVGGAGWWCLSLFARRGRIEDAVPRASSPLGLGRGGNHQCSMLHASIIDR